MAQVRGSRSARAAPYRVVLAGGSATFRRGLTGLLARNVELEVVGEAADVAEVLRVARRVRPDVVVVDTGVPGDSEEAAGELLREVPDVSVLTLTSTRSMAEAAGGLRPGASGYVLRDAGPELLVAAIIAAAHGYAVSPRPIMPPDHPPEVLGGLSSREFEVLRDLADGMNTKTLANRLGISEKTVRNHIASMYAKLGLHDRSQLIRYAIQKGLCGPLEPDQQPAVTPPARGAGPADGGTG